MPRDLEITSQPDLINCLNDIKAEIKDDFPELPFDFDIRLLGSDLGEEGITQNQRLGDLSFAKTPLAEILTQIMVQANPDKNISGPQDPNCKLVWVVGPDPDAPEIEKILITTRKAAAAKEYVLPEAFQTE